MEISKFVKNVEKGVFAIRWMLVPIYIGLIAALGLYIAHFVHEVYEMATHLGENVEEQNILLLFLLELLDMALISQLVMMTVQGGYAIFIHPLDKGGYDLPQWLKHGLSTSDQKIKMGMSIINIMLVQMLDMYIKMSGFTAEQLQQRMWMLGCAIAATLSFCVFNILMHPEMLRRPNKHDDKKHDDKKHDDNKNEAKDH